MAKDQIKDLFGVESEEVDKMEDFPLTLDTSILDDLKTTLDITFLEDEPREVKFKELDKDTQKEVEKTGKVISVEWEKDTYTLWLSAQSLLMQVAKLYKDNEGLKDVHARLRKIQGTHPKYGKVKYYKLSKLNEREA